MTKSIARFEVLLIYASFQAQLIANMTIIQVWYSFQFIYKNNSAENIACRIKCSQNLSPNSHEKTFLSPLYFKGHMIFENMTMHLALRGIPSATVPPDAYDHGCDAGWMSSDPKCSVTGERVVSEQESTSEEQFIWFSTTLIKGNEEAQKHVKKYLNMKIDEEEIDISHVCIGEMKLFVETDKVGDEFESFNDEMNRCVIMKFWMMKMSQMTINKKDKTEFLTKCVFRDVICRLRNKKFPFYIHSFRINGTKRTRQALLESVIYDALQARTLGTIIDEVRVAADKLNRLDIFQYVDVFLNSSNDPRTLDVILSVEEKSRFWIKTGTEI
ncbi:14972_t:CDS:2, partial [Gigaspora rosea]